MSTKPSQQRARQRLRIPQLKWSELRGYHVNFKNSAGQADRYRFDLPKEKTAANDKRAENQWRIWVVRNIPEAAKLPEFADLSAVAQAQIEEIRVQANPQVVMPNVIREFLDSERARVRAIGAPRTQGTMSARQYDQIESIVARIGEWSKSHFGDRFLRAPFSELWTAQDYKALMSWVVARSEHRGDHSNGKNRKGFAPTYAVKFRLLFWRLAHFAEDYPYEQRLRFTQEKANRDMRFAMHVKSRPKTLPDLQTLKRLLAFADLERRTWMWMSIGCGLEPIALATCTRRCVDETSYDLTRTKTGLLRRGRMPAVVWWHIEQFLKENPRGPDDLMFVTRDLRPIVDRSDRPENEQAEDKSLSKENNALSQAWQRLRERAGVKWGEGFRIFRSLACTIMTKRPNLDMATLWDFMGHAVNSDTWKEYAQYITPTTRPMIEWVRDMLDSPNPKAWRDAEVRKCEEECRIRREQAKENSRWKRRTPLS